jgi:uncharacterized protein (DUF1778 family)
MVLRKTKATRKDEQTRIRLAKREKRTLEAAAVRAGLPLASWIRSVALRAAEEQGSKSQ